MDAQPQLLNRTTIEHLKLQVGADMLPVVIATFVREGEAAIELLEHIQTEQIQHYCHTLKSSAAAIGADALAQQASMLDQQLKDCPHSAVDLAPLQRLYRNTLIVLRSLLN
ncbi:Hpt domain-containing protein [Neiella sp. HB171785]|uniref:Hpt domain-containing protein n=1 Tax=Neiella litorisoli TaxID=2771431 RepID=A0A8J6UGR7_9GAMM|nr:Hpt domain-containing protein [Neiella litorisoli]MBD1390616.1 Hpt domain-containing protein [Neiella litorisoli]